MPRRAFDQRKRRTRAHVVADLGVNHVERQALLAGYTVERWAHDYGLDLVLFTYTDSGQFESGMVFLQVKATDHLNTVSEGRFVTCRIERMHLRAWLAEPMPVILIVYDAVNNRAFWLYIQAEYKGAKRFRAARGSEFLTVRIPTHQIFDPAVVRRLRTDRQAVVDMMEGIHDEN